MLGQVDFWFVDDATEEEFFVELDCDLNTPRAQMIAELLPKAMEIAEDNFDEPHLIDVISVEEAERMGYDTY